MIVGYVQDPKAFRFWSYVAPRPAKKPVGVYLKLDSKQFVRVPSLDAFVWADGADRPTGETNKMPFEFVEYSTTRYDIPVRYGNRTLNASDIPLLAISAAQVMSQTMVLMNKTIITALDTAGNWGTFTGAANTVNGGAGKWDAATSTNLAIKKTFNAVATSVRKNTNAVHGKSRLKCIVSPDGARGIAESAEFVDMLKQSPYAMAQVRGDDPNALWSDYGLPNQIYGVDMVVEDGVIVTQNQGDTASAQAFLKNADQAVFVTVVEKTEGDQVGSRSEATYNPSSFHVFQYDGSEDGEKRIGGMVLETWPDPRNKRTEVHCVCDFAMKFVSPETGYLVTDILT